MELAPLRLRHYNLRHHQHYQIFRIIKERTQTPYIMNESGMHTCHSHQYFNLGCSPHSEYMNMHVVDKCQSDGLCFNLILLSFTLLLITILEKYSTPLRKRAEERILQGTERVLTRFSPSLRCLNSVRGRQLDKSET